MRSINSVNQGTFALHSRIPSSCGRCRNLHRLGHHPIRTRVWTSSRKRRRKHALCKDGVHGIRPRRTYRTSTEKVGVTLSAWGTRTPAQWPPRTDSSPFPNNSNRFNQSIFARFFLSPESLANPVYRKGDTCCGEMKCTRGTEAQILRITLLSTTASLQQVASSSGDEDSGISVRIDRWRSRVYPFTGSELSSLLKGRKDARIQQDESYHSMGIHPL
jgi:hypothetical protein